MPAASVVLLLERPSAPPPPSKTIRRFSVWGPADLPQHYTSIEQVLDRALSLVVGLGWDEVEFLVKAGEGGSWQQSLSWHPLHISGPASLQQWMSVGAARGIRVTPYVVVRGRGSRWPSQDWRVPEQAQIRECCRVAGRCVMNLEPSVQLYWGGPFDAAGIVEYLVDIGVAPEQLEVAAIPRQGQVTELGGAAAIEAWTATGHVSRASWECYGITAGVPGETSLLVNEAIPRLDRWSVPAAPEFRIPIVQRDERSRWADTQWTTAGMQVWYLDGN